MYRTMLAALGVACLALLGAAAAQQKGDAGAELKKLRGSWTVVSLEIKGQKVPEDKLKEADIKLVLSGDKYAQEIQGKIVEKGKLKLDPSKKPAAIDLVIESGKDKGKMQLGIYMLKGDTLRLCLGRAGSPKRPTSFTSNEDEENGIMTLKRDKK